MLEGTTYQGSHLKALISRQEWCQVLYKPLYTSFEPHDKHMKQFLLASSVHRWENWSLLGLSQNKTVCNWVSPPELTICWGRMAFKLRMMCDMWKNRGYMEEKFSPTHSLHSHEPTVFFSFLFSHPVPGIVRTQFHMILMMIHKGLTDEENAARRN